MALLGICLLSCAVAGQAAELDCPAFEPSTGHRHALDSASVFDGKPEELADLEPQDGVWDLQPYRTPDRQLYLVCRYSGTKSVVSEIIPATIAKCQMLSAGKATLVSCH